MLWPKKNSYNEFDNEKKFLRLENSPPPRPHNFSNGPSLKRSLSLSNASYLLNPPSWASLARHLHSSFAEGIS